MMVDQDARSPVERCLTCGEPEGSYDDLVDYDYEIGEYVVDLPALRRLVAKNGGSLCDQCWTWRSDFAICLDCGDDPYATAPYDGGESLYEPDDDYPRCIFCYDQWLAQKHKQTVTPIVQRTPRAIQPLPTIHNGVRYRSRLEARWSVFFFALGIPVYYEYEGYDLRDGIYYLPDFYLPDQDCWIEVKPQPLPPDEQQHLDDKLHRLATGSGKPVVLVIGPPAPTASEWNPTLKLNKQRDGTTGYLPSGERVSRLGWTTCAMCRHIALISEAEGSGPFGCRCAVMDYQWTTRELVDAFRQAQQIRFR